MAFTGARKPTVGGDCGGTKFGRLVEAAARGDRLDWPAQCSRHAHQLGGLGARSRTAHACCALLAPKDREQVDETIPYWTLEHHVICLRATSLHVRAIDTRALQRLITRHNAWVCSSHARAGQKRLCSLLIAPLTMCITVSSTALTVCLNGRSSTRPTTAYDNGKRLVLSPAAVHSIHPHSLQYALSWLAPYRTHGYEEYSVLEKRNRR